jgi:hypothetical protein
VEITVQLKQEEMEEIIVGHVAFPGCNIITGAAQISLLK